MKQLFVMSLPIITNDGNTLRCSDIELTFYNEVSGVKNVLYNNNKNKEFRVIQGKFSFPSEVSVEF